MRQYGVSSNQLKLMPEDFDTIKDALTKRDMRGTKDERRVEDIRQIDET